MVIKGFLDEEDVHSNFYYTTTLVIADKFFGNINGKIITGSILLWDGNYLTFINRYYSEYGQTNNGEQLQFGSKTDCKNFVFYHPEYFPNFSFVEIEELIDALNIEI